MNMVERILAEMSKRGPQSGDMQSVLDSGLTLSERAACLGMAQVVSRSGAPDEVLTYFLYALAHSEQTAGRNPLGKLASVVRVVNDLVEGVNHGA